ncbi:GDSL-type esterase/lipase family protein [Tumebacillus sp. DT12]|uniref:GDSL-type esterase/lipase family protein n=1 Tax=Tumebacillus lacus TaxID=2995335 RepID=A0ABT3X463_9BACL|nr:GDSL-type esterase/lipase family protein [Tumebacillus lacus]MCX7571685.1 GDSL-type esterase/lipase family protein [Tumebacillus lacus]
MADTAGQRLLVALGDSITAGVGGKWNKGYAEHLHELLQRKHGELKLVNWGIPGLTIPRLRKAIAKGEHLHDTIQGASMIVMTIGGNDLLGTLPKKMPADLEMLAERPNRQFARDLDELMLTIRSLTRAPIYLGDLYNPFPQSEYAARLIGMVNRIYLHPLADRYSGVHIVHLNDVLRGQESTVIQYYKSGTLRDLKRWWRRPIHPNDTGHQLIARAFHSIIRSTEPPKPKQKPKQKSKSKPKSPTKPKNQNPYRPRH